MTPKIKIIWIKLSLLVIMCPSSILAQQNSDPPYIVITHVNVIDATGSPVQSDMTVVVKGNRIIKIEKTSRVRHPENALKIDGSNKYLIPGLWDMHVHVFNSVSKAPADTNDFNMYVANGVTGIREMWTHLDAMPQVSQWRKQFNEGTSIIPRIGAVGTMIDGVPPTWHNSDTATTAESARQFVQRAKAAGIDFIKTYNRLPRTAYFAVAEECKKVQLSFAGHIPNRILLKEAADAGQRSIEHLTGTRIIFEEGCVSLLAELETALPDFIAARSHVVPFMKQVLELCDDTKAMDLYRHLAEKNVSHCPTMVLYKRFATDTTILFGDSRLKYITPTNRVRWKKETGSRMNKNDSTYLNRVFSHIALMKKAGILFLAGTDVDNHYLYPGFSLHDELDLFVKSGFTTMESLQTATINPAKFLGVSDSLGTIQKGKIADMVLLNANPLTDIRNTQKIDGVFLNGKYLSKQKLQALLKKVEDAVNKN